MSHEMSWIGSYRLAQQVDIDRYETAAADFVDSGFGQCLHSLKTRIGSVAMNFCIGSSKSFDYSRC